MIGTHTDVTARKPLTLVWKPATILTGLPPHASGGTGWSSDSNRRDKLPDFVDQDPSKSTTRWAAKQQGICCW
jgi:hypothetical protein